MVENLKFLLNHISVQINEVNNVFYKIKTSKKKNKRMGMHVYAKQQLC